MSTIVTSNVSDGTLSIPTTYVTTGSAKAWVNFNGTGTIAARDSFNVASLTDNGTGDYTVNFSSAFGAVDFAYSILGRRNNATQRPIVGGMATSTYVPTTSSLRFITWVEAAAAAEDAIDVNPLAHGDLA